MKITAVTTYPVAPRWLFVRVDTDEGLVGWGEASLEGRADTVATAIRELSDLLIGRDPMRIEDAWQVLTKGGFYRGGAVLSSAVAGVDQALWDLTGKALGVPVSQLLGGRVRDRIRVYSWVGGDRPDRVASAARAQVDRGFDAIKMNASGDLLTIDTPARTMEIVERVATVRDAVGPEVDIAIDFHGRVSPAMARRLLPLIEPYLPMFAEEVVLPDLERALAGLVSASTVPLATGERLFTRHDVLPVLEAGVAVIQPDLSHAGGISEGRRIATMADTFGVSIAPHCPLGPIALASCLQLSAATPNFLIQEQSLGMHYNGEADLLDYLVDVSVFDYADGHVAVLEGPGLGIEVDQHAVERAAEIGHRWRNPVWRHADGSFAEW